MRFITRVFAFLLSLALDCTATAIEVTEVVVTLEPGPVYSLEGQRIEPRDLKQAFLHRRSQGNELVVVVRASREATFEQVSTIVRAAQEAGAKLNMQGNVAPK